MPPQQRPLWKTVPLIAATLVMGTVATGEPIWWSEASPGCASAALAATLAPRSTDQQKSQADLAAKIDLGTISPNDPAVAGATDARDLTSIRKLTGKEATLIGTVSRVYISEGNGILILNFTPNYKEAATVVLKPANYARFPDMRTLSNKRVLVSGKVVEFRGRPEIELREPSQIKIVKG